MHRKPYKALLGFLFIAFTAVVTTIFQGTNNSYYSLHAATNSKNNSGRSFNPLYNINFESGRLGNKTLGSDAFSADAGSNVYTNTQVASGNQAAKLTVRGGSENTFGFGGALNYTKNLTEGDELWWQIKVFFPIGFDYTAHPRLKFMRMGRVTGTAGAHRGYVDFYILPPSSSQAFSYDPEMDNPYSLPFGSSADKPQLGVWETYEGYVKFSSTPGVAQVRFWKNGKLLFENNTRRTMLSSTDRVPYGLLFTYWNGNAPKTQSFYIDDLVVATSASPPTNTDSNGNVFIGP